MVASNCFRLITVAPTFRVIPSPNPAVTRWCPRRLHPVARHSPDSPAPTRLFCSVAQYSDDAFEFRSFTARGITQPSGMAGSAISLARLPRRPQPSGTPSSVRQGSNMRPERLTAPASSSLLRSNLSVGLHSEMHVTLHWQAQCRNGTATLAGWTLSSRGEERRAVFKTVPSFGS